jgi:hypothetical protein
MVSLIAYKNRATSFSTETSTSLFDKGISAEEIDISVFYESLGPNIRLTVG